MLINFAGGQPESELPLTACVVYTWLGWGMRLKL